MNTTPPYRHILGTLLLVFLAELLIMYFLSFLPPLPTTREALLDAALLTLITTPILYFFWIRPHSKQMIAKLAMVVRQTEDIVVITDIRGFIEYVNPAFEKIAGYSSAEVIGKKPSIIKSGNQDQSFYASLWNTILSGRPFHALFINRKKNGELYYAENTIAPLMESGNHITHFVSTGKDVTSRRHLEHIVSQSEKLASVGLLAAGVSHEINNPLAVILGFAQSVLLHLKGDDPLLLPLKSIEREALRCRSLVQDLLRFSRAPKDEQVGGVDANAAIRESLSLILARSKTSNVELINELAPALPTVKASKHQLQQVVINLCNNAVDATPRGGKVTLRTSVSRVKTGHVEIQGQDTGAGIPKEIQAQIFEPFFTTKEIGKGTGLGLSLVHEIVQKHRGSIGLRSEIGRGTTFTIYLPAESPPGHAPP